MGIRPLHVRVLAGWVDRRAGSHVYHQILVRELARRGHRVSLLCFEGVPEIRDCAEVFEVSRYVPQSRLVWRIQTWLEYLACRKHFWNLSLGPADVVVAGEHFFAREHAIRFPETPWIYLPHSMVVDQEILGYRLPKGMHWATTQLYGRLQRWSLRHATRILRFSRQACQVLVDHYGVTDRSRFVVNPMGVTIPDRVPDRIVSSRVRLLFVGQCIPRKRLDLALTALSRLKHYAWDLDIVGEGPLREELYEQVRNLGLVDRVRFHGFQTDPGPWYERAQLFLLPSQSENSPVVVLEAMAYGVPCLVFRADGQRICNAFEETIEHGTTGLLAHDLEDFGHLLEGAFRDPSRLLSMGEAARRYVMAHRSWDKHLDRYEQLFEILLRKRTGGVEDACMIDPIIGAARV